MDANTHRHLDTHWDLNSHPDVDDDVHSIKYVDALSDGNADLYAHAHVHPHPDLHAVKHTDLDPNMDLDL